MTKANKLQHHLQAEAADKVAKEALGTGPRRSLTTINWPATIKKRREEGTTKGGKKRTSINGKIITSVTFPRLSLPFLQFTLLFP